KTTLRKGVILQVTEVVAIRVTLELGATTQSVTVAGVTPLVDTATNTQGQVVNSTTIQQLPLNGRNYTQLAVLTAGTVPSVNKDQSFSAFGNRGMQNEYLLDGGLNESFMRGIGNHQRDAMRPSLEAIEEFKVQTSNYSAEYGASAGGVVSVVTRSGTNEIHGSAFDFLRNAAIGARDFFAPPGPVPQLIFNQFGGSLGGPIKKNRAWLFGAYQATEIRQQSVQISTVPTTAMKSGTFPTMIYDPNTTVASGANFIRTAFPNNTIPASEFNQVGRSLVQLYPDPNLPGLGNNYIRNARLDTALHNATFRGDVQVTSKDSMFARFSFNRGTINADPALPSPANTPVARQLPAWNVGYGYTRVFGPSLVNEFRLAFTRPELTNYATLAKNEVVPNALAPGVDNSIPTFSVTGFAQLGAHPAGYTNDFTSRSSVWEFSDNATKNLGAHILKFGFTHQFLKIYMLTTLNGRGVFTFDGSYTQNPQSRTGTGSGLADLLLGLAQQVQTSTIGISNLRAQNDYSYFQDDWKITQRLTLNLGVRYELYWPMTETNNKLADFVLDPSDPNYGHLVFAGLNGQSRSLMNVDKGNVAPRFGFAYRVPHTGDLTIRGGYGMFYGNPDEQTGVSVMMTNNPPFVGAGSVNLIGDKNLPSTAFNLSGSLPATQVISPQNFVLSPSATTTLISWPRYYKAPVVNQWNLSLEKELPDAMVLEVSYVGNSSYGNWNNYNGNQPLTPGPGAVASRRPLAQYTDAVITMNGPWDHGHYEGMTARLEKRMARGLYFLTSFTYGRAIDLSSGVGLDGCGYCGTQEAVQNAYNLSAQRGPSDSNVPRRLVFSAAWDLPFGKGQRYLQSGPLAYLAGGWQASGIWTAQDGSPFTLALSVDNANVGQTSWPNRVCDGRNTNPTLQNWFNQSCFPTPPVYTYGNAGRNVLYGPDVDNLDFALHRFFPIPIRESMKLEFRGEFFNFLNHPEFGMPAVTLNLPTTGQITTTSIPNRQVQFALKLLW
ncbi:MAG TPA: TonB-dependent receptor, partial [Bryobacteraceae bacterium]|nr:TonB-dependent receptor [Bryobacteraceae bacterium]